LISCSFCCVGLLALKPSNPQTLKPSNPKPSNPNYKLNVEGDEGYLGPAIVLFVEPNIFEHYYRDSLAYNLVRKVWFGARLLFVLFVAPHGLCQLSIIKLIDKNHATYPNPNIYYRIIRS